MNHRQLRLLALLGIFLTIGCTRPAEERFAVGTAIAELPPLHQENIQDGLQRMFGSPSRPRILADREEESSAEESGDSLTRGVVELGRLQHGAQVYRNRCAGCHGISGDGEGSAAPYLQPRPRDYRGGVFKFTSTPYGDRPARQDLVRTIRRGAKGTSMPAFPWISNEDLDAVVDYVIYLSLRGRVEDGVAFVAADDYDEDETIDPEEFAIALESECDRWRTADTRVVRAVSAEPAYDEASVERGRRLFIKESCYQCHGVNAKGQTEWLSAEFIAAQQSAPEGKRVPINYDAWDQPAPAADITARMLHGGRRPLDIYRRIYTGINGTPMPAFVHVFRENPDDIWHLVHYVMHIVDGGDPTVGINSEDVMESTSAANGEESG